MKQESRATSLGKRWASQMFNKPGKDLDTAFTVKQEHTHSYWVSMKGKG